MNFVCHIVFQYHIPVTVYAQNYISTINQFYCVVLLLFRSTILPSRVMCALLYIFRHSLSIYTPMDPFEKNFERTQWTRMQASTSRFNLPLPARVAPRSNIDKMEYDYHLYSSSTIVENRDRS
jgi:hypothetical protein